MAIEAEAGPSSQEPPAGPWDTTFNRAMNVYKERDKSKPPTSAGRVTGFGTAMKFTEYYSTDTDFFEIFLSGVALKEKLKSS